MSRFAWHAAARLFGPDGAELTRAAAAGAVLPAVATSLPAALAREGQPFRIGAPDLPAPQPGDPPMFETLTSGSLGQPRRIWRSQASWLASFAVNARLFGIGPGQDVAVLGALDQSLALYGAIEGLCLGARVHLLSGLRPDRQASALAARAVALLYATPAQLRLVAEAGKPLPGLRQVLVGGAKLDTPLRAALGQLAPQARVTEFYGAAEASFITLSREGDPPSSVGAPYPGVTLQIRTPQGLPCAEGEIGEIWVQSPYLFRAYAEGQGSARSDGAGWLTVGEWGSLAKGVLALAGRAGRMVTVADQNVFPEEIEAFLALRPGVRRVAVLPVHDARRGAVLVALIQGDAGAEAALLAAARAELGPLKAPRRVIWLQDWPQLPSGKTDLRALEALL